MVTPVADDRRRPGEGNITWTLALWAVLTALLALPVWLSQEHLLEPPPPWSILLGATGISAIVAALYGLLRQSWAWWSLVALILLASWLRGMHYGLVDFSGAGFTREVFIHAEWQSLVLVWEEYGRSLRKVLILLLLVSATLLAIRRTAVDSRRTFSAALLLSGVAAVGLAHRGLPEADLLRAWQQWNQPLVRTVDPAAIERLEATGLLTTTLPMKQQLSATLPPRPKNLVLLYLESVGVNLSEQPRWPGLMPNFHALKAEHGWVDHLWASSYITIEGLTNSMCGTLFPYVRGNDAMAEGGGLAENLACLGDILALAGYQQTYLGGAGMSFAGKGDFLTSHGYDSIRGLDYWREQGLDQRPGTWGLSDADLFDQSIETLRALQAAGEPFNMTLLTIGTHLPGYRYRECEAYAPAEDRFLQALHCTDQLLGQWVDRLKTEGLLEDTLLVITADHHVFPSPDMRALFGDSVLDRRLPLIVVGDDLPAPAQAVGAGYDLAPTVLDLLGVQHDGAFALGRSLLRPAERPDYFVTRYLDVLDDQPSRNTEDACVAGETGLPPLPLRRCDKGKLMDALSGIVAGLSAGERPVSCNPEVTSRVTLPVAANEPLELLFNERSEADRFIYQGRRSDPRKDGLFLLAFSEKGQLLTRRYFPANALATVKLDSVQKEMDRLVAVWRPPVGYPGGDSVMVGTIKLTLGTGPELLVLDARGQAEQRLPLRPNGPPARVNLRQLFCTNDD